MRCKSGIGGFGTVVSSTGIDTVVEGSSVRVDFVRPSRHIIAI